MFRHGTYYMIANDSDKTLEIIIINYANTIGNLGLVKNYGRNILKLFINIELIQVK